MSIIHQFPGLSDGFINIRIQSRCGTQTQNSSHSLHHCQLFNHYPNTIFPHLTTSCRLWNCSFHPLSSYYVIVIDQFTQTLSSFQNPDIFISTQILNMVVNLTLISYNHLYATICRHWKAFHFQLKWYYIFVNPFKSLWLGQGAGQGWGVGIYGDRSGKRGRGELVPKKNHHNTIPSPYPTPPYKILINLCSAWQPLQNLTRLEWPKKSPKSDITPRC